MGVSLSKGQSVSLEATTDVKVKGQNVKVEVSGTMDVR